MNSGNGAARAPSLVVYAAAVVAALRAGAVAVSGDALHTAWVDLVNTRSITGAVVKATFTVAVVLTLPFAGSAVSVVLRLRPWRPHSGRSVMWASPPQRLRADWPAWRAAAQAHMPHRPRPVPRPRGPPARAATAARVPGASSRARHSAAASAEPNPQPNPVANPDRRPTSTQSSPNPTPNPHPIRSPNPDRRPTSTQSSPNPTPNPHPIRSPSPDRRPTSTQRSPNPTPNPHPDPEPESGPTPHIHP